LSSQGIYLYNEGFNSKISCVIFDSRLAESNAEMYSSDIAQFLKEDNGYIICLIKNETYILSKSGNFLSHKTEDFVIKELNYRIIPYGHDNNEYYYAIFSINDNDKIIIIRQYIFNSSSNSISLKNIKSYNPSLDDLKKGITCQLMNYLYKKVITCFYGDWSYSYCSIFNITNFEIIPQIGGKITTTGAEGGQLFVSSIIPETREKVVFCAQKDTNLVCYGYI
jgi:hypothetical protein